MSESFYFLHSSNFSHTSSCLSRLLPSFFYDSPQRRALLLLLSGESREVMSGDVICDLLSALQQLCSERRTGFGSVNKDVKLRRWTHVPRSSEKHLPVGWDIPLPRRPFTENNRTRTTFVPAPDQTPPSPPNCHSRFLVKQELIYQYNHIIVCQS